MGDLASFIDGMKGFGIEISENNFPVITESQLCTLELSQSRTGCRYHAHYVGDKDRSVERVLKSFEGITFSTWIVSHRELRTNRRIRFVFVQLVEFLTKITKIKYRSSITGDVGAPQCIVVEPQEQLESQSNLLEYNENPLVVTKTYAVKWQKDAVDLVKLAKRRWIDQMSYREIGKSMGITRGQVDWNLRKFRSEFSPRQNPELRKIWTEIEKERKK
jgi:hypothetical protein